KAKRVTKAVLQEHSVARRQRALDMRGADPDPHKMRPAGDIVQLAAEGGDPLEIADIGNRAETGARRDDVQPCAKTGMTGLHSGLAEMAVVQHHDREGLRLRRRAPQQGPWAHDALPVTSEY